MTNYEDHQHERIMRQIRDINNLVAENSILRMALLLISEHKEPYKGFTAYNGSNGLRDHFKAIAESALNKCN